VVQVAAKLAKSPEAMIRSGTFLLGQSGFATYFVAASLRLADDFHGKPEVCRHNKVNCVAKPVNRRI
jgi:hypothetical protein